MNLKNGGKEAFSMFGPKFRREAKFVPAVKLLCKPLFFLFHAVNLDWDGIPACAPSLWAGPLVSLAVSNFLFPFCFLPASSLRVTD